MNPQCARCGKVVYPTEKVNCLDKVLGRGRAGTAPPGRARSPRLPRVEQGRAGGGAGRGCRWQMQRLRGCRCAGIRGDNRRITALAKGGVRAGAAAGRRAPAVPAWEVRAPWASGGSPRPAPGSPTGEVVGGPPPGCSCRRLPELRRLRRPLMPRTPRRGRWPGQLVGDNPVTRGVPR